MGAAVTGMFLASIVAPGQPWTATTRCCSELARSSIPGVVQSHTSKANGTSKVAACYRVCCSSPDCQISLSDRATMVAELRRGVVQSPTSTAWSDVQVPTVLGLDPRAASLLNSMVASRALSALPAGERPAGCLECCSQHDPGLSNTFPQWLLPEQEHGVQGLCSTH